MMRVEEKLRISHTLGQFKELLGQSPGFIVLGPGQVRRRQPEQYRKKLGRVPDPSAELQGPVVSCSYFRDREAPCRHQGCAQGNLQLELQPRALETVREGPEQVQSGV